MIEAVKFFGPTFFIFNHSQHGPDAIPLKNVKKSYQQIYAVGLVLQQQKCFKGLRIHFNSKYFKSNTYNSLLQFLILLKSGSLGYLIIQLIIIPFARSRKEILSEEVKSHSQLCKHDCVLVLAR